MNLPQRIRDWLHEREIQRLADGCKEACAARDRAKAKHFWNAMYQAIRARSPEQVERMEKATFRRLSPSGQQIFLKHVGSPGRR